MSALSMALSVEHLTLMESCYRIILRSNVVCCTFNDCGDEKEERGGQNCTPARQNHGVSRAYALKTFIFLLCHKPILGWTLDGVFQEI